MSALESSSLEEPKKKAKIVVTGPGLCAGEILDGRYQIESLLATGGMATIYRATHTRLGSAVAIKVVSPKYREKRDVTERFVREARALMRLKGENVVRVLDIGATVDGLPYMAMELLEGHDLRDLIEARCLRAGEPPRGIEIDEAVDYILQSCKALAEAHRIGLVHRDLKPANLFLTAGADGSPCIKLIDFGLSHGSADDGPRLTAPGMVMGSPGYMPPEQMEASGPTDHRSDVWGLGAVLFHLLTGEQPFVAPTYWEIYALMTKRPPPSASALRADVPPALDAIIARCLQVHPDDRFPNMAELAMALVPYGRARAAEHAAAVSRLLDSTSVPPMPIALTHERVARAKVPTIEVSVHDLDPSSELEAIAAIEAASEAPDRTTREAERAETPGRERGWRHVLPPIFLAALFVALPFLVEHFRR